MPIIFRERWSLWTKEIERSSALAMQMSPEGIYYYSWFHITHFS